MGMGMGGCAKGGGADGADGGAPGGGPDGLAVPPEGGC